MLLAPLFLLWLLLQLLPPARPARADAGPAVPYDAFTVGVIGQAPGNDAPDALALLITMELQARAFRTALLPRGTDGPATLLSRHPHLDFVIDKAVADVADARRPPASQPPRLPIEPAAFRTQGPVYLAFIYTRGQRGARRLEAESEAALAAAVLGAVTDSGTLEHLLFQKEQAARQALARNPSDPDPLDVLGLVFYVESQLDSAVAMFERALAAAPRRAGTHYNLYLCYRERGDQVQQRAHLEAALAADPTHENAQIGLANHFFRQDDYARAIPIYRALLASPVNGTVARYNLALGYVRTGEPGKAREVLEDAPAWAPPHAQSQALLYRMEQQARTDAAEALRTTERQERTRAAQARRRALIVGGAKLSVIVLCLGLAAWLATRAYREIASGAKEASELKMQLSLALFSAVVAVLTTLLAVFF